MATTGTEKHCRLCLMLNKGGTQACHTLLLRRVEQLTPADHQPNPWTIHEFLQSKKKELLNNKNISKEKLKVLFPGCRVTDLSKWDLSLFCTILTIYCGLTQLARLDVERLRTLRNELCHMNDPDIDDVKYKDYFETIKVVVTRILQGNSDNERKQAIDKILNDIHEGPLSLNEILKEMHTFYSMEMDMREKLENVHGDVEHVLQKVERFDSKLDQISNKLDHEACSRLDSARNNFLIPGVEVFLDLKNLSTEEEQRMSTVLEQLFEEVISKDDDFISTIPADSHIRLREAVRKTFKLFLKKGWRITSARHKCIRLHIRCLTFKSLAALFREHVHGQINVQLADLNAVVSESVCGKEAQFETVIYKDEFWSVLDKTISAVDEFLTDQESDINPTLHERAQHCGDQKKHTLSLTASNVTHEEPQSFEKDCENELDTCLRLLESELKTEFAPHVSIQASYTPKRKQNHTDQEEPTDECTTSPIGIEAQKDVPLSFPSASTSKTVDEEHSSHEPHSEVEDKSESLQTIASVELCRSQRAIAQYLELAYLSLNDYQDVAEEIYSTSESARRLHLYTLTNVDWSYLMSYIKRILRHSLNPAYVDLVIGKFHAVKASMEKSKRSYTDLQGSIRKHISHFEIIARSGKHEPSGYKQVQHPLRNIKEAEKAKTKEEMYEFENLYKINLDEKLSVSDKDIRSRIHLESYTPVPEEGIKADVITEDKFAGGHGSDIERLFTMPRPGAALTGGLSTRGMNYIKDIGDFGAALFSRHGIHFDVLKEAYRMSQEETGCTTQPFVVQRMMTQQKETLDRLEKIRKKEEGDIGIECLREVDRHLSYIDLQLARMIECWSKLIAYFDSFEWARYGSDLSSLHVYTAESRDMIEEEWDFVQKLFVLYGNGKTDMDYQLNRFLSLPIQYTSSDYRAKRKQKLLLEIENEASAMYLPPGSGSDKSSDQHSDTGAKGKEQILKREETMGKPKQMQSRRGRLLPFFKQ